MVEPAKPFACTMPDCGMTFTNEDHLNVHTKKHDMVLSLGMEQKAAFVGKDPFTKLNLYGLTVTPCKILKCS